MKAYREVRAQDVPNARVARKTADLACAILGLAGLKVRFFEVARGPYAAGDAALDELGRAYLGNTTGTRILNHKDIAGVAYALESGTIWVRADLSWEQTVEVVLHEAKHVADFQALGSIKSDLDRAQREQAAEEFAREWCDKLEERRRSRR